MWISFSSCLPLEILGQKLDHDLRWFPKLPRTLCVVETLVYERVYASISFERQRRFGPHVLTSESLGSSGHILSRMKFVRPSDWPRYEY